MKQANIALITLFLFTASIIGMKAQTLVAYHVVGQVTCNTPGGQKDVVISSQLTPETTVNIPYGGKLELLDEAHQKRITLKTPGKGTIKALSAQGNNSILELSTKYVAYVKKQLNNRGLVSRQRYTDFATVTRELDSVATVAPKPQNPFASQFNQFRKGVRKEFDDFRKKCNKEYNDFVRQAWEQFGAEPPKRMPDQPRVEPVILKEPEPEPEDRNKLNNELTVIEQPVVVMPEKQPQPVVEIKPVPVPPQEEEFARMPFIFFGNELEVRLDETRRINLGKITPDNVADILERLSTKEYDNLLYDCLKLRQEMKLCDWAYLLMIREIAEQFCGEGTNEASILTGFLYCQSGYKMRFAADDNRVYLLVASKHEIYGKPYYRVDGELYYPLEDIQTTVSICKASFPRERDLSLFITNAQKFMPMEPQERTITSKRYKDFSFQVTTQRSLMDFYEVYPSSLINDDFTTRWVIYAETPMAEDIKAQLYPAMQAKLQGLSELEAVSRLLNFVQTGFEYEYDDKVWGYDRPFFAEESLHYPFCDCEDRSVLFTRLVRDLLHLDCALVYYPGHLAAAVHFTTPVKGDYFEHNGKDYTLCDPTFINAAVGRQMPMMADKKVVIIPIK